jgi:membrane-bound serine protease (ClpP class)
MDELGAARLVVSAGDKGKAVSMLRPVGCVEFAGEMVNARSEGDFIAPGTPVVALRIEGSEVVVQTAKA